VWNPPPAPPPPPSNDDKKNDKKDDKKDDKKSDKKKEVSTETLAAKKLTNKEGKSLLNKYCADYRDSFKKSPAKNKAKIQKLMTKCMNQDCAQSLEGGSESKPGCRFLSGNGFCYAYSSAQMWCKDNKNVKNCDDGGDKWAASPLGTAESKLKTAWKPREDIAILDSGEKTKDKFSCVCMKGCAINGKKSKFLCADENTKGVGDKDIDIPSAITKNSGKKDQCACKCGDSWG